MAQDEEGLLKRWSRRKLEQRERERQAVPTQPDEESGGDTDVVTAGGRSSAETPAAGDAVPDLPAIESLTRDSDFTVFLREGVPDDLRNLALQKLWRSDPVFANLDGMLEYGEDYSQLFKPGAAATLKTLYRVGQGYLADDTEAAPESPVEGSDSAAAAASAPSAEKVSQEAERANRDGASSVETGGEGVESANVETPAAEIETPAVAESDKV